MANVIVDKNKIDILANAISAKSGEPVTMTLDEMVEAVDGIESGITPTGTITITTNGTTDVTNYAIADVQVPGSAPTLQTKIKTYTPTESQQTEAVTFDSATYDGLDTVNVTVNAISSTYVGTGITRRSSSDLTASGATVSVPSGYYESNASKAIANGSATPPTTISGSQATLSTGTNTITLQKTLSVTPRVTAGYVASGTADNVLVSLNANVTTKAAATIYPSASDQSIASGTYLTGAQTIKGVTYSNLTADNIKNGVTVTIGDSADADRIASVTGTYSGGGGTLTVKTATTTKTATGQTVSFSSLSGQPKYWFLRITSQLSSSGSTTYYYITDLFYDGTNIKGNSFRIGSTRRIYNITSGISQSYSGGTLTITGGSSTGASPGQFYGTSNFGYELVYIY